MKGFTAALVLGAVLALASLTPAPASAQTPAISVKRLSLGLTAEYVVVKPASAFAGINGEGEVKVGLPIAYNLGRFSSLQAKARYGVTSQVKEYSVGITLHILARGSQP